MSQKDDWLILRHFSKDWFIYDDCPYIKAKLLRGGHYSRTFADNQRRNLCKYVWPALGGRSLESISPDDIEAWLFSLKEKGLSHLTINHIYSTLRLIVNEAYRKGYISSNPASRVKPLITQKNEKGTLQQHEVQQLFGGDAFHLVWDNDLCHYLLNVTASRTGMRTGELQALRTDDVHPDYIHVRHSWDRTYGLKSTKNGHDRIVPVPKILSTILLSYAAATDSTEYIFSRDSGNLPLDHLSIYRHFCSALCNIGITEVERKRRNITLHSWRHYYNSFLRLQGVPDQITRAIIGHASQQINDHYTHFHADELIKALSALHTA